VRFSVPRVGLESVDWTSFDLNPILAMLALSDIQDLACLRFGGGVGLECARHILEVVKAVKRRSVEFLCLLTDIIDPLDKGLSYANQALILEGVKRAMEFMDEEPAISFLRPMLSGVKEIQRRASVMMLPRDQDPILVRLLKGEARRICGILQAKLTLTRFISSTMQLRVLSCARSAAVAQPAMGWLRMHEPL
jgi:hypothetical protein